LRHAFAKLDAHLGSQLLGHLTGSGFALDSTRQRLLLLHHGRLNRWLQPGGHGEGETDPRLIAQPRLSNESRELRWFPLDALPDGADSSLRRAAAKLTVSRTLNTGARQRARRQ
jgi:8-oxo-dGTP pyrophosphatase MutT (NUDIX family)